MLPRFELPMMNETDFLRFVSQIFTNKRIIKKYFQAQNLDTDYLMCENKVDSFKVSVTDR